MAGWYAETEEGAFAFRQPADHLLVEERRDLAVEKLALFFERPGPGHFGELHTVQPGHEMACADEASEQAGVIDVPVKHRNATTAGKHALRPVSLGRGIKMFGDEAIVTVAIAAHIGAAEVTHHVLMGGQMAEGGELQLVQRNVMRIEVNHVDAGRVAREIGQHVAAAGTDGDDTVTFAKLHRLHVDLGIFPDLRIDEAGEKNAEEPFGEAAFRESLVLEQCGLQFRVLAEAGLGCRTRHLFTSQSIERRLQP